MHQLQPSAVQKVRQQAGSASENRRNIGILSAVGLLDFVPISLYQLGVIRHMPDLPGRIFDSDYVNASKEAQIAGLPDGPVSLLMYAANVLLVAGAIKKKKKRNLFDYLIAGNAIGQAAGGAYYLYNMATVQKKVCIYCVTGALINFATLVPLYKLLKLKS
ncbi:vitamin K epoxide reductase family protein [Cesiribacter sp. SM1]|uniref:vitamin K epoxide reductase family protein n=1 Tax=Cesiribacter sp. SM1 TaxID=2861196 RepID=UPI001CD80604|nr:vitamin K epoxide reductase family protein [Cesiribacter sp. SM1]